MTLKKIIHNEDISGSNQIHLIFQPHLRPIVRGKSKSPTEFGEKIGASIFECMINSADPT